MIAELFLITVFFLNPFQLLIKPIALIMSLKGYYNILNGHLIAITQK